MINVFSSVLLLAFPVHRSRLKRRRRETPPDGGNHGRERNSPYNWLGGAATAVKSCNLITGDRNKCAPDKWAVGVMNYRPTWRPSVSRPNESHRSNRALGRPIRHNRDVTERWRMQTPGEGRVAVGWTWCVSCSRNYDGLFIIVCVCYL